MRTTIIPWAQHFDPRIFTEYQKEAISALGSSGHVTVILDEFLKSLPITVLEHWHSRTEQTKTIIESHAPVKCLGLLMGIHMPHVILPLGEAIIHALKTSIERYLEQPSSSFFASALDDQAVIDKSDFSRAWSDLEGNYAVLAKQFDDAANYVVCFLKQDSHRHKNKIMNSSKRTYSLELRSRFWALLAYADSVSSPLHFMSVTLSEKYSRKLMTGNNRWLAQKVDNAFKKVTSKTCIAGICVIEPSPSSRHGYHFHMILTGSDLVGDQLDRLKKELNVLTDKNVKTAVHVKDRRQMKCVARTFELSDSRGYIERVLEGIDMGAADYISKDLCPDLMIGKHKQLFSINNDLYYNKAVGKKVCELTEYLRKTAQKHIQPDGSESAKEKIKECITNLFLTAITRKFIRESTLILSGGTQLE